MISNGSIDAVSNRPAPDSQDPRGVLGPKPGPPAEPGGYRLRTMIGRGGFGEVWEAVQVSLGRIVAMKTLRGDLAENARGDGDQTSALVRTFRQEAITTAGLDHPGIVPIYDIVEGDGGPQLAMKRVRGTPWDKLLIADLYRPNAAENEFLTRHLNILASVAQAVAYAHARGIVHRDIKPSQVVVGDFGEVFLMDWGLAFVFDEGSFIGNVTDVPKDWLPMIDSAANPAGTPAYMAPEQTEPMPHALGPWTDVFLLGATLYHILTGTPLYTGDPTQVFFAAASAAVEPPRDRAPGRDIPPALERLAMRCLARLPEDRIPSVRVFLESLHDYLAGSSRRREAETLAERLASEPIEATVDYATFTGWVADLEELRALWPQNPRLWELRRRLFTAYAQAALRHGDLNLSKGQARRIPDGPERTALLEAIEQERVRADAESRQRVVFRTVAVLAIGLLVALAAQYSVAQGRARRLLEGKNQELARQMQIAERERDLAMRARGDAEDLVGFMVTDLRSDLLSIGKLQYLETTLDKARSYFDGLPRADQTDETRLEYAKLLRVTGDMKDSKGDMQGALDAWRQAVAIVEDVKRKQGAKPEVRREYAVSLSRLSDGMASSGNPTDALPLAEQALSIADDLLDANPGDFYARRDRLVFLNAVGNAHYELGEYDAARDYYSQALDIARQQVPPDDSMTFEVRSDLMICQSYLASALTYMGRSDEALSLHQQSIATLEGYLELEPDRVHWHRYIGLNARAAGELLMGRGELMEAKPLLERSVRAARALMERDPLSTREKIDFASASIEYARVLTDVGTPPEAIMAVQDGVETLKRASEAFPENHEVQFYLSSALIARADIERDTRRYPAAYASLTEAQKIVEKRIGEGRGASGWKRHLAAIADRQAGVALLAGDYNLVNRALERYESLARERGEAGWPDGHPTRDDLIIVQKRTFAMAHLGQTAEAWAILLPALDWCGRFGNEPGDRGINAQLFTPYLLYNAAMIADSEHNADEVFDNLAAARWMGLYALSDEQLVAQDFPYACRVNAPLVELLLLN